MMNPSRGGADRGRVWVAAALLFSAGLAAWCVWYVPPNMDEFSPFLRLSCSYPYAQLNSFREGCNAYWLDFGAFSYQRSFTYIGITPSLIYKPFWLVWRGPESFYVLGLLSLAAFAVLMSRALRLPVSSAVVASAYFPIAYSLLKDFGPLRLTFVSVPVIALLGARAIESRTKREAALCGLLAGLLVVVAAEEKIFYLLCLPVVVLTAAGCIWSDASPAEIRAGLKRLVTPVVTGALVAGVGVGVLLVGRDGDRTYFELLQASAAAFRQSLWFEISNIVYYTLLWPMFALRTVEVKELTRMTVVLWAALGVYLAVVFARLPGLPRAARVFWGAAFLSGALMFAATGSAIDPHHFVILHIPIVAALMRAARHAPAAISGYLLAGGAAAMIVVSASDAAPESHRERDRIFAHFSRPEIAQAFVLNFSSWGGYYHQALFGSWQQLVTFTQPLDEAQGTKLAQVARRISRNIMTACLDCDAATLRRVFGRQAKEIRPVDLGLTRWRVFEVHLETGLGAGTF